MTCSIEGCAAKLHCRGWCRKHYARWSRTGSTEATVIRDDPTRRFWSYVEKTDTCWLWQGKKSDGGYGIFVLKRRTLQAHRYGYEMLVGPIPAGLTLDHLCRVRNCVNPAHLEPVTLRENLMRGNTPAAINAAKTHCPRGHELYQKTPTSRGCRTCSLARDRARPKRQRVEKVTG